MKVIKILGIEKKPKSKKYVVITDDLNYTVSEDMVIKHQLFKEKSFFMRRNAMSKPRQKICCKH